MYCDIYLRKNTVYVPTMGQMDKGFYRGVEPVAVVSVIDTPALRQALAAAIARGNPPVPMLQRRDWPPPVLLKYAGVRSWSSFERGLKFWSIYRKEDSAFQISEQKKQSDRMWRDDAQQTIKFSPGASVDGVIDCMTAILQDTARR